jgi:hypothetical protein
MTRIETARMALRRSGSSLPSLTAHAVELDHADHRPRRFVAARSARPHSEPTQLWIGPRRSFERRSDFHGLTAFFTTVAFVSMVVWLAVHLVVGEL